MILMVDPVFSSDPRIRSEFSISKSLNQRLLGVLLAMAQNQGEHCLGPSHRISPRGPSGSAGAISAGSGWPWLTYDHEPPLTRNSSFHQPWINDGFLNSCPLIINQPWIGKHLPELPVNSSHQSENIHYNELIEREQLVTTPCTPRRASSARHGPMPLKQEID